MHVIAASAEYDELYPQWQGKTIALVPTMGALHEGHMALVRKARQLADVVIVSIFVNPLQFGPNEDLARYPRPLEQDLARCRDIGVDVVFTPAAETLYPEGMENVTTVVPPASLTNRLCGEFRPGHFTGVATVVLKLFNLLRPHFAVFGEKDAQQLMVIRTMVRDLHVPVTIIPYPTVRESTGLALSSRNRYLQTAAEQQAAGCLFRMLIHIREQVRSAPQPLNAKATLQAVSGQVLAQASELGVPVRLQYLEAVDKETFAPVQTLGPDTKILVAAYVNQVRLIDNMDMA